MTESQHELWQRLEAFELDDPQASLTFSRRLARENGWDVGFARRVVGEYKRFVFLAMTTGSEVTPSDEVDQAWHLHLTYTRSYWGELCGEVLGRPLHHGPTKGGATEGERFEDQYERTLAAYRKAFNAEPPSDIWPPSEIRFGEAADFVRVNRQRVWLLGKPWKLLDRRPVVLAGAMALVFPPLAAEATLNPLDFDGPQFLRFYTVAAVLAVCGALVCRKVFRTSGDNASIDTPLALSELAALRAGWQGAFHAGMASLLRSGALEQRTKRRLLKKTYRYAATRPPEPADEELQAVLLERAQRSDPDGAELDVLGRASEPIAKRAEESLTSRGLIETATTFASVWTSVGILMVPVLGLGVAKLIVGIGRGKPVLFLVAELFVLWILFMLLMRKPFRTPAGERVFKATKDDQFELAKRASKGDTGLTPVEAATAVALFGIGGCAIPEVQSLQSAVQTTAASSGGCGSGDGGSGCGGGGCGGGGCGGCGGCGG